METLKTDKVLGQIISKYNMHGNVIDDLMSCKNVLVEEVDEKYKNIERIVIINERELDDLITSFLFSHEPGNTDSDELYGKLTAIKNRLFYPKKKDK